MRKFGVVQRLDAESISHDIQEVLALIEKGDREFAAEMCDEILSIFLVQVNDDLGIRTCTETVPPPDKISGGVRKPVQLAVEDHPDRAIFIRQRLLSTLEIDDGQACVDQQGAAATADV